MTQDSAIEIAKKTVISEVVKNVVVYVGTLLVGVVTIVRERLGWRDAPELVEIAVLFAVWVMYRRERQREVETATVAVAARVAAPDVPENAISVRLSQVRIVIEAADSGVIYFTLLAFNDSSIAAEADRLDVHSITIGTYMLKTHDQSISKVYTLPPRSPAELTFAFGLESVNVRIALTGITPAPNLRATPTATTRLSGTLVLMQNEKRVTVGIEQQMPPTQISIVNSVVDALKSTGQLSE